MSLGDHLRELRRRLFLALAGLAVGAVVGWAVYPTVFTMLQQPIADLQASGLDALVNFDGVATPFDIRLKVSLFVGTLLASPWWIYQIWAYVAPAMTRTEKRNAVVFVSAGVVLFLAGAYLAWSAMPNAVRLLAGATPATESSANYMSVSTYLAFVMQFTLAFGLAFLLPLLMVALTAVGVVRGRTWARGWRWAIVIVFAFAALATPTPDAISMIMMAIPMCALYGIALLICRWLDKRRDARIARRDAEYGIPAPASNE